MAGQWNENLSNELKKLNTIKNPNAQQKARIEALKGIKTSSGGAVRGQKTQTAVQMAGNFQDPSKVAGAQQAANEQTAQANVGLNRLNESNTFGQRVYNEDGSITDTLSPGQQGLFDAQTGTGTLGANVAGGLLQGLQGQGAYNAQSLDQWLPQGSDAARQDAYNATYGQLTRDLQKNKARDQQALEQRLADQGIPLGSKQYNDQMQQFNQRYDDQELQARNQATLTGNQAFQQTFDMGQQNYGNKFNAYQSNYSMPASIAGQLQGLSQVQAPQFGQGVVPIEQQGLDLGGYYETATGKALKQKELAIAAKAAGGRGGSGGGGGQGGFPTMGGVAGAGVPSQQQKRPGIAGTLGNSVVQGITAGATNNLMK